MSPELTHIDLFSGAGGLATGFSAAGIQTVAAVEHVKSCVDTYAHNHPYTHVIHSDVRKVEARDFTPIGIESIDIVTAGVPCETFSTAGSTSRSFYDARQVLYREAIRIAILVNARLVVIENVPGLLTKKIRRNGKKLVVEQLKDDLLDANFSHITSFILNSADYGVPQLRDRLFFVASKEPLMFSLPKPLHTRFTVGDAFYDLPTVEPNGLGTAASKRYLSRENRYVQLMKDSNFWKVDLEVSDRPTYHDSPKHRPQTLERFSLLKPGEGLRDLFLKHSVEEVKYLQSQKILPKKWYIQRNRRLKSDSQSPTVTSHCIDELVHPEQDRALTVREAARLQSFPDWYEFVGGPNLCPHKDFEQDKYEQIGDAVPPLLAYAIAVSLRNALTTDNRSQKRSRDVA